MSQKMKMFHAIIDVPAATSDAHCVVKAMVYGGSEPSARKKLNDVCISLSRASELEIAAHVRAGLPIIGEPDPVDENQHPLPL